MASVSESKIDYNKLNFKVILLPECYLAITLSAICFTLLFVICYYIIIPTILLKRYQSAFPHIKKFHLLHWKVVDTVCSMIHGIIIILLCIYLESVFTFSLTQEMTDASTSTSDITIASISVGYLLYDTVVGCIICSKIHTKRFDKMYIFHHIVAMSGCLMCVFQVYGSRPIIIGIFINEITNPILHINNLKNKLIPRERITRNILFIDLMMKLVYLITFCLARFVWLNHILYQVFFELECSIYFKIVAALLIILPFALLPSLLMDLSKTYNKYKKKESAEYSAVNVEESCSNIDPESTDNEFEDP